MKPLITIILLISKFLSLQWTKLRSQQCEILNLSKHTPSFSKNTGNSFNNFLNNCFSLAVTTITFILLSTITIAVSLAYSFLGAESETGPVWSGRNDARTTPFGKFLRRTHIDELPQLINVLKGDSFVSII